MGLEDAINRGMAGQRRLVQEQHDRRRIAQVKFSRFWGQIQDDCQDAVQLFEKRGVPLSVVRQEKYYERRLFKTIEHTRDIADRWRFPHPRYRNAQFDLWPDCSLSFDSIKLDPDIENLLIDDDGTRIRCNQKGDVPGRSYTLWLVMELRDVSVVERSPVPEYWRTPGQEFIRYSWQSDEYAYDSFIGFLGDLQMDFREAIANRLMHFK